jgi:transcription antitermination factor NusG
METQTYHTLGLTKIQRTRIFPGKGDILVKVGQKLDAVDPIGEYVPEEKFQIINLKKELGFQSGEDARRSINVKVGDKLKKGDLIAKSSGFFPKSLVARSDSEVLNIIGSQLILKLSQPSKPILAGFNSIVTEILPFHGVVMETNGALIQGVWGNQKAANGPLIIKMRDVHEEITTDKIDVTYRGSILMGGYCRQKEVIQAAEELNLKGLIFSSMSASLIPVAKNSKIPVLLIEGFGSITMNERAFELIKSNEGNIASINCIYDNKKSEKPELIIQVTVEGNPALEKATINKGSVVRINSGEFQGKAAVVKKINQTKSKLPSGINALCGIVELSDEDLVSIPLANLDILE